MSFQIHPLPYSSFAGYFTLDTQQLLERNACLEIVQENPGTPCRVSLEDAKVGETVLLVNYKHLPEISPYQSSHAIFVRKGAKQYTPAVNEVPQVLSSRLISVRAFDEQHFMVEADVVEGTVLGETIDAIFEIGHISYIHLHNAKPGCFAAKVTRA
ncbi:MAG: DUF1203 domain-containing protein [Alphaproteobacteria bacterium]